MSAGTLSSNPIPSAASSPPVMEDPRERGAIDASTRVPVLLFFGTSIFWLVVGSLLALISTFKLNIPGFLDGIGFFTYGRLYPAQANALIYGWASTAGMGVGIWLMARLCRVALPYHRLLVGAVFAWNLGVLMGVLAILAGYNTGVEGLEFPAFASGLMFLAYLLIAIWSLVVFYLRKSGYVYVSQWYLLAAFLIFPWLYGTANLLLTWCHRVPGSAQGPIQFWYSENVFSLWFTCLGLASAYYMIPKILGRPIHSYYLSILGFWSLLAIAGWSGMYHLFGGPIPAWMGSAGVAAGILMVIPIVAVAINHHMTMVGGFKQLHWSPTLRFTVFGTVSYTLTAFNASLMALPTWNTIMRFTDYSVGQWNFALYGFFSMAMFGAMYYIVPRLVGWEWPSLRYVTAHFWLTVVGIGCIITAAILGGIIQGFGMNDPGVTFQSVLLLVEPWRYVRTVGFLVLTAGNLTFALLFAQMILKYGEKREGPVLFTTPENV